MSANQPLLLPAGLLPHSGPRVGLTRDKEISQSRVLPSVSQRADPLVGRQDRSLEEEQCQGPGISQEGLAEAMGF